MIPQVQGRRKDITQVVVRVLTDDVDPAGCVREDFRRRIIDLPKDGN
ncbi:hypothetical protein ES703_54370 [subsurface metagenome]